jgi:hypothetical protein
MSSSVTGSTCARTDYSVRCQCVRTSWVQPKLSQKALCRRHCSFGVRSGKLAIPLRSCFHAFSTSHLNFLNSSSPFETSHVYHSSHSLITCWVILGFVSLLPRYQLFDALVLEFFPFTRVIVATFFVLLCLRNLSIPIRTLICLCLALLRWFRFILSSAGTFAALSLHYCIWDLGIGENFVSALAHFTNIQLFCFRSGCVSFLVSRSWQSITEPFLPSSLSRYAINNIYITR